MFRSDALYIEMNYMIENLSQNLLNNLVMAAQQLASSQQDGNAHISYLTIANCVLHIFESILSQEELPDFYEENLATITGACAVIL